MKIFRTAAGLMLAAALVVVAAWLGSPAYDDATRSLVLTLILAATTLAGICLVAALTGNDSQVDKAWSLAPIGYCWLAAAWSGFDPRLTWMSVLVTLWGLRLSFNFWLRGGYRWPPWRGAEDHRWAVLRERPEFQAPGRWLLFQILFISGFQHALILLMTAPIVVAFAHRGEPLSGWDGLLVGLFLSLLVLESVADWQQWRFQQEKRQWIAADDQALDLAGFIQTGLWSLSRHPNYVAEQALWISFYGFSVAASHRWLNESLIGAVLLVLLFQGSIHFGEQLSAGKYPGYADYQQRVPKQVPWPRRPSR